MADEPRELVSVPQDLTLVSLDDLRGLESRVTAEFDRINDGDTVSAESLEYLVNLANDLDRVRAELVAREERDRVTAASAETAAEQQRLALLNRVHGPGSAEAQGDKPEGGAIDAEVIAAAASRGATEALVSIMGDRMAARQVQQAVQAGSLAAAATHAPVQTGLPRAKLKVQAGVDIPGIARGAHLSLDELVEAFARSARGMPTTRDGRGQERLVASVRNEFEHTLDDRTSPAEVNELFKFLTSEDKQEVLLAGGGWCAPSEVRYDFFNVACSDGLVDLPTFGVSRGGIRFPTSPSLADVYANPAAFGGFSATLSSASVPWLWTETDDIATVTGSPNKPAIRVPCPAFGERRLECFGITLTAGNLTDDAYPEATSNFLRLLLAAHEHAINGRILSTMLSLASSAVTGGSFASAVAPVFNQVYGAVALAATDYRAKYGMCDDDILEVVLPIWLREAIRSDLAWRLKVELLAVTDAQINSYFAARRIRPQWVNDWQVRGSGQFGGSAQVTAWPTSFDFLIYAAGTFLRGDGLTLDLGVVRDSVLNAENDFTAAWSEECHLVAMVGHAAWRYTVGISVNGGESAAPTGDYL